jgi:glutamyl-tRNA reductase
MIGIDHANTTLEQREVFAFTKAQAQEAMINIQASQDVKGCIIISTCNRTELWISEAEERGQDAASLDLGAFLCSINNVNFEQNNNLFVHRRGIDAIRHLFETTCGMKSQIWGENQILTQVKQALENSRSAGTTDKILEKLFQYAITSAKRIKTETRLTPGDVSIASRALEMISRHFSSLNGLRCLVIGNGEIGRLMASLLVEQGLEVTMTKRHYKQEMSLVPHGCLVIAYENRLAKLAEADLIVSATSSPHYTIKYRDIESLIDNDKRRLYVDLAVPRDIDPAIMDLTNVTLINTDDLGQLSPQELNQDSLQIAHAIIEEGINDLMVWDKARRLTPIFNDIAISSCETIKANLWRDIQSLDIDDQQRHILEEKISLVVTKVVKDVLFGLKDKIEDDSWEDSINGLETIRK